MRKLIALIGLSFAFGLAGCTAAQIESAAGNIESDIQAGTAALCGIIPTVATIVNVVGAVTGTTEITSLVGTGVSAIESDICSAAPPPSSARYRALPRLGSVPVTIGNDPHGVPVTGWRTS